MKYKHRLSIIVVATLVALTVLHKKPWSDAASGQLDVGFLPVTCHLTCPVTDYATKTTTTGSHFDSKRYSDFPTVVEALKARKLDATFLLAPLAMVLREQGVPIRIGHLTMSQVYARAARSRTEELGLGAMAESEIPLPGLADARSQMAVPFMTVFEVTRQRPGSIEVSPAADASSNGSHTTDVTAAFLMCLIHTAPLLSAMPAFCTIGKARS